MASFEVLAHVTVYVNDSPRVYHAGDTVDTATEEQADTLRARPREFREMGAKRPAGAGGGRVVRRGGDVTCQYSRRCKTSRRLCQE